MRAGVFVALLAVVGACVGAAWWWIHWSTEATARAGDPGVSKRGPKPEAEAESESAPAPVVTRVARKNLSALGYTSDDQEDARDLEPRRASDTEAAEVRSVVVHVVDAETKAELGDVSVIRMELARNFKTNGDARAPAQEFAVEHSASPVSIVARDADPGLPSATTSSFFVTSSGYVREFLMIDFLNSSERTVELRPAATLVIDLRGELPEEASAFGAAEFESDDDESPTAKARFERQAKIRIYRKTKDIAPRGKLDDGFSIATALVSAQIGETTLDDVVPGDIVVSVEVGSRPPIVLASKPVNVVARQVTRVVLDVARFAVPKLARLAGTLRVPAGESLDRFSLEIGPRDIPGAVSSDWRTFDSKSMVPLDRRGEVWKWDAGELLPGKYSISIRGTEVTKVFELPPAGATDVALEVPAQAKLHVHVVNSSDGRTVKLSWLDWTPRSSDGEAAAVSPILLLHDDATHTYRSNVPLGRGELESFGADLWALDAAVRGEIHPGEQEIIARVHTIGGALLEMKDGGAPLEIERRAVDAITVAPVGGSGRCIWKRAKDKSPAFAVDPPGRWLVTLPALDGYEAVEPFEVVVEAGKFTKVAVELRRR